jgi:hypothetical protein
VYEIVAVPDETPVTTPVDELTVATEVEADDHVPPNTVLDKVVVDPLHTVVVPPDMVPAVTAALTVITFVALVQPIVL